MTQESSRFQAPTPDDSRLRRLLDRDEALARGDTPKEPNHSASLADELKFLEQLRSYFTNQPVSQANTPRRFGRFEILREIGRGGCGIVFLADDPWLGRPVALKIPRHEFLLSPQLRRNFITEAKAAALFDHPHIVTVYEAGEVEGFAYIASAYCSGPTLAHWLAEQSEPIAPKEVAALMATLARTIHHTHLRGVIHRDLKPSNILLHALTESPTGLSDWSPRITDFGLAHLQKAFAYEPRSGAVLGTPAYMSPEQTNGREVGPATDIWALGVILYQLLTRKTPFQGPTDWQTLLNVRQNDPLAPRKLRRDLPRDLEAICLKCLAKNPADRYVNAAALAEDLQRFLEGRSTLARPLPRWDRAWRWCRRNPAHAALSAVIVLLTIGLGALSAIYTLQLQEALQVTESLRLQAENASQKLRLEEAHTQQRLYAAQLRNAFHAWENADQAQARALLERHRPRASYNSNRCPDYAWHQLWQLCHTERLVLTGHTAAVHTLAFHPNGRWLASASADGRIGLWRLPNGELVQMVSGHASEVNAVHFTPDGQRLLSTSDDGTLRIWEFIDREHDAQVRPLTTLRGHQGHVYDLGITPDCQTVVTTGQDRTVRVWNVRTGTESLCWKLEAGHRSDALALSPDGQYLATAGREKCIRIWRVKDGKQLAAESTEEETVRTLTFCADGSILAVGGESTRIRPYAFCPKNAEYLKPLPEWYGHANAIEHLTYAPNGLIASHLGWPANRTPLLASASRDGTVRLWWEGDTQRSRILRGHTGRVWGVAFGPPRPTACPATRTWIASAGADQTIRIWDLAQLDSPCICWRPTVVHRVLTTGSPNQETLIFCSDMGHLAQMTLDSQRRPVGPIHDWPPPPFPLMNGWQAMTATPDGQRLFLGRNSGGLVTYDRSTSQWGPLISCPEIRQLALSPDQRWLASIDAEGQLVLRNPQTLNVERSDRTNLNVPPSSPISWAPNSRSLMIGVGNQLRCWHLQDSQFHGSFQHRESVRSVCFSPDGSLVATGSDDRSAIVWRCHDGKQLHVFQGRQGNIRGLVFSHCGRLLLSVDHLGQLRIWSLATNQELCCFDTAINDVHGLMLLPHVPNRPDAVLVFGRSMHTGVLMLWHAAPPLRRSPENAS